MTFSNSNFPFRLLDAHFVRAEAKLPPIERTDYPQCTVEYIVEGRGFLDIDGEHLTIEKDGVYILHKHSTHSYRPDPRDPWVKEFFVADGELMETLFRAYGLSEVHHIPNAPELKKTFDTFLAMNLASYRLNERAAVVFHEFVELCAAHLAGPETDAPPLILALKEALVRNLEEKFDLAAFCRKADRSEASVIRSFRSAYKYPPLEYRMRCKLEAAERLLLYSTFSMKEISARLGFTDQYAFSNFFKERNAVAPTLFRKRTGMKIP